MRHSDSCKEGATDGTVVGDKDVQLLISEIQLLLSEKQTALAVMRTGIAILALPLSVFSVLIATSKYYNASEVMHLFVPLMLINAGLILLAVYLIVRSTRKLHALERMVGKLKGKSPNIAGLIT
ncbi:MAG: hypothetical protein WCI75_18500 [candidate division NC10 bacterium]